jgi:predicted TIM-barrel fold metal-dependent hydrolase
LERYPHVYVDTSQYLLDGGIEALVADYGARRVLFGSGFPESYFGGMMMALKHAEIPLAAKRSIAHGNLSRILEEVRV